MTHAHDEVTRDPEPVDRDERTIGDLSDAEAEQRTGRGFDDTDPLLTPAHDVPEDDLRRDG